MTILYEFYDEIRGEKILCEFRKMAGPWVIAKTHTHQAQRIRIVGYPANAIIEKHFQRNGKKFEKLTI